MDKAVKGVLTDRRVGYSTLPLRVEGKLIVLCAPIYHCYLGLN
jgi:hypothetical protein